MICDPELKGDEILLGPWHPKRQQSMIVIVTGIEWSRMTCIDWIDVSGWNKNRKRTVRFGIIIDERHNKLTTNPIGRCSAHVASRRQFSGVAGALRGRCGETRAKRGRPEKLSCDEWRRRLATSSPSGRESQVPNVINTTSAAPRHDIDDYPSISDSFSLPVGCWKCKIYRICSAKTNPTALLFDSCKMTSSICACIVHYSIYHTALYIYNQLLRSSFTSQLLAEQRRKIIMQ